MTSDSATHFQNDAALAKSLQEEIVSPVRPISSVIAEPVVVVPTSVVVTGHPPRQLTKQQPQSSVAEVVVLPSAQIESAEQFCGPISCAVACILVILFWPAALCVPLCPCDNRRVIRRYVVH